MEKQLEQFLQVGDFSSLKRLVIRSPTPTDRKNVEPLVEALLPHEPLSGLSRAVREHPLFLRAVQEAAVPATKEMAHAGDSIARAVWGARLSADESIRRGLDAESALYFAIERDVGTRSLSALLSEGPANLDEVLAWALRIQQSRKSRRGQSLQHHFSLLLTREGIPYTPQCVTERGETPDFVIPGEAAYHDPKFPSERLRMVACKSTVRERWGQILKEADRIRQKYLLTVDETMSGDVLRNMRAADLTVFLPAATIAEYYAGTPSENLVGNVGLLLEYLRAA
jgi:hypothetical protein